MERQLQMVESLPPDKRNAVKKNLEIFKGRNNSNDLDKAKSFAIKIINKS